MVPNKDWILNDKNKILREHTKPLTFPISSQDQELIDKMVDYIEASYYDEADKYDIRVGVAVAANQVGLDKSVIYIHANDINDNEFKYLLANPKIVSHSQGKSYLPDGEGCLSVDDEHKGIIPRYSKIVVKGIDLLNNNKEVKIEADGMLAIIMQHEIDHLYGTLFYDYINKEDPFYINPEWNCVKR